MVCLEIDLNGARVCRAGLGKRSLVHMNAAWHSLPRGWNPKGRRRSTAHGDFGVSGVLYDPRPPGHENVSWTNGEFAVGDELRVRLVESDSPDEPSRRERSEPIPEADQWEMICDRLDGCARDLSRLKRSEAKELARQIRSISKKGRGAAAQPGVADRRRFAPPLNATTLDAHARRLVKTADDVISEIEAAFVGVPFGQLSLHEADLMDSYGATAAQRQAARDRDPERDWREVSDASLRECDYALSYLDPLGWRFYLPAFMRWRLRDPAASDHVIYSLDPAGIRQHERLTEERFRSLDQVQVRAVCAFLRFVSENGESFDDSAAKEALAGC
jgi:hypothetical protein